MDNPKSHKYWVNFIACYYMEVLFKYYHWAYRGLIDQIGVKTAIKQIGNPMVHASSHKTILGYIGNIIFCWFKLEEPFIAHIFVYESPTNSKS